MITRILANYCSGEETYARQVTERGILARLNYIVKDGDLTMHTLSSVMWLLANLCAHSTALRDQVLNSSCFIDSIKRSLSEHDIKTENAAAWLCSNSLRSTEKDILNFEPATELVSYLVSFAKQTSFLQVLADSLSGMLFYLSVETEIDKRAEKLLQMNALEIVALHLNSNHNLVQELVLELLGQITRYEGPFAHLLCVHKIWRDVAKIVRSNEIPDKFQKLAFESVRNMVAGTEKTRNCVILNDREMFQASIDALLIGDSSLKCAVLDFLATYFLTETNYSQLLNVYDSNLDVGKHYAAHSSGHGTRRG